MADGTAPAPEAAAPADTQGTPPHGDCAGGVAHAPRPVETGVAHAPRPVETGVAHAPRPVETDGDPAVLDAFPTGPVPLAVPPVLAVPAFQMLGSDDVGVCVDGVCAVPSPSAPEPGSDVEPG